MPAVIWVNDYALGTIENPPGGHGRTLSDAKNGCKWRGRDGVGAGEAEAAGSRRSGASSRTARDKGADANAREALNRDAGGGGLRPIGPTPKNRQEKGLF